LQDQGETEWMCVICGFDNKPRSKHCIMCGTSYKFTMEYKVEKSEMKKKKQEAKKRSLFKNSGSPVFSRMHADSQLDSVVINRENDINITPRESAADNGNSSSSSSAAVVPRGLATPTKQDLERSIIASPELQAILLESVTTSARGSLSGIKRREAFNYRRLNLLSLRQKSARRRKMLVFGQTWNFEIVIMLVVVCRWQRQYEPETGEMIWVRASVKETMIGSAPFGYSPKNSVDNVLSASASIAAGVSQSVPFRSQRAYSDEGSGPGAAVDSRTKVLFEAALGKHPPEKSEAGSTSKNSKDFSDSFGDPVLLSSSPGYTSRLDEGGNLTWEKVEYRRAVRPVGKTSSNIGVSTGIKATTSSSAIGANASTSNANGASSSSSSAAVADDKKYNYPLEMEDLEAVAAMTFREKQLWFLNYISRLQKPWSEGCVVMDLHRDRVLEESVKAIMSIINTSDLHKWLRIQFIGEPGIDAGGIEREWFDMIARVSQHHNIFNCTCVNDMYLLMLLLGSHGANDWTVCEWILREYGRQLSYQPAVSAI
jgi:hypothetical protein